MLKHRVIASSRVLIEVQDKTWHLTWLWRSLMTEGQAKSEEDEVKGKKTVDHADANDLFYLIN